MLANDKILERAVRKEESGMKRKVFLVVMIIFTVMVAVNMFISLICGAPLYSDGLAKYVFCAVGLSIVLPSCFTVFLITILNLHKQLDAYENEAETKKSDTEILDDAPVSVLVNALAKKRNLTSEEKERLLSYLEDL